MDVIACNQKISLCRYGYLEGKGDHRDQEIGLKCGLQKFSYH